MSYTGKGECVNCKASHSLVACLKTPCEKHKLFVVQQLLRSQSELLAKVRMLEEKCGK